MACWLATGAAVFIRALLPVWLTPAGEARTALRLERRHPEMMGDLITSVQLGGRDRRQEVGALYSLDLIEKVSERAADVLRDAPLALDRSRLRRMRSFFWGETAVLAAAILVWPSHFLRSVESLLRPPAQTQTFTADGAPSESGVVIGDIAVKYFYPVYTRRPPEEFPGSTGDLKAIRGTRVEIGARCSRPVRQASLVINGQTRAPLRVDPNAAKVLGSSQGCLLSGELVMMEPGSYQFEVVDEEGRTWLDPSPHAIHVEADEPPTAELVWPKQDLEVSEKETINLLYQAGDDFGLSGLALVYEQNEQKRRKELSGVRGDAARVSGKYAWNLSELRLEAEAEVAYHVEATDNDTVSGPKRGASAVRRLKVFSARQRHRELISLQEKLLKDMLHLLSSFLVRKVDEGQTVSRDPLLLAYEEIGGHLSKALDQANEILRLMPEDKLANYSVFFGLNKIKDDLASIQEHRRDEVRAIIGRHPLKQLARELVGQLAAFHAEQTRTVEDDTLFLSSLIERQHLEEAMAEAEKLAKSADALGNLLEELKKKGGKETADKILRELEKLEEMMARIAEQLAKMGRQLPDEFLNLDALKDLGMRSIEELMQKLREALAKGDHAAAQALVQELLKAMAGFADAMSDSSKQYAQLNYSQMLQDIQQYEARLEQLKKEQEGILDETKKLKADLYQRMRSELDKRFKDFFAKQVERAQRMQNEVKALKSGVADDPEGKELAKRLGSFDSMMQKHDDLLRGLSFDRDLDALDRLRAERSGLEDKMAAEEEFLSNHPGYSRLFQVLRTLPGVENQVAELKRMLEGWDAPESLSLARQVVPALEYWKTQLERGGARQKMSAGMKALEERSRERVESAAKIGREILEDLENLKSAVSDLQRRNMGGNEMNKMGELAQRQGKTRQSAQNLQQDMGEFSQKTPLLGQEPGEHLQAAGESMRGAENDLNDRNPGAAVTDEREALYRLSQALEKLREGKNRVAQGMMGKGMPMPMWMGAQRRGTSEGPMGALLKEVQLPTPEDYKAPKEFRQDILDAMRGPSPRGFEEQNKRYYRKLVE